MKHAGIQVLFRFKAVTTKKRPFIALECHFNALEIIAPWGSTRNCLAYLDSNGKLCANQHTNKPGVCRFGHRDERRSKE